MLLATFSLGFIELSVVEDFVTLKVSCMCIDSLLQEVVSEMHMGPTFSSQVVPACWLRKPMGGIAIWAGELVQQPWSIRKAI